MITVENSGALIASRTKGAGKMADVKIKATRTMMVGGAAVLAGEEVTVDERVAKSLLQRGVAVPAGKQEKGGKDKGEGDK